MENDIRREANDEMRRRPYKQRRIGPDGELGRPNVPPDRDNPPSGNSMGYDLWRPKQPQRSYSPDYGSAGKSWVTPRDQLAADRLTGFHKRALEHDEWEELDEALAEASDWQVAAFVDDLPVGDFEAVLEAMGDRGVNIEKIITAGRAKQHAVEAAAARAKIAAETAARSATTAAEKAAAKAAARNAVASGDEVVDWLTASEKRIGAQIDDLYRTALRDGEWEQVDELIAASSDREIASWFRLMSDDEYHEILENTLAYRADSITTLIETKPLISYSPTWRKIGDYDGLNFQVINRSGVTTTIEGRAGFSTMIDEAYDQMEDVFGGTVPFKRDIRLVEIDRKTADVGGFGGYYQRNGNIIAARFNPPPPLYDDFARLTGGERGTVYHEFGHMLDYDFGRGIIDRTARSQLTFKEFKAGVAPKYKLEAAYHELWGAFEKYEPKHFAKFDVQHGSVLAENTDTYMYSVHEVFAREFHAFVAHESGDLHSLHDYSYQGVPYSIAIHSDGLNEIWSAFRKIVKEMSR
jgi:hypothetical protein